MEAEWVEKMQILTGRLHESQTRCDELEHRMDELKRKVDLIREFLIKYKISEKRRVDLEKKISLIEKTIHSVTDSELDRLDGLVASLAGDCEML